MLLLTTSISYNITVIEFNESQTLSLIFGLCDYVPGALQFSSSDPSWQCAIPSQRNIMWMHLWSETHANSWSDEQDDTSPKHTDEL